MKKIVSYWRCITEILFIMLFFFLGIINITVAEFIMNNYSNQPLDYFNLGMKYLGLSMIIISASKTLLIVYDFYHDTKKTG